MAAFPVDDLKFTSGFAYAHVFENAHTRLTRDLFWSFNFEFEGPQRRLSTTLEWIRFSERDWRRLKDISWLSGEPGVEASVYLGRHHEAQLERFSVSAAQPGQLEIRFRLHAGLGGLNDSGFDDIHLERAERLRFDGILIDSDSLFPKPKTRAAAIAVLEPFADPDAFDPPEETARGFKFLPKTS